MVKAHDFVSRRHIPLSTKEVSAIKKEFTRKDYSDIPDIDDPKYNWKCVYDSAGDEKYGRFMVSYEQKIWRNKTMGEFYGGGIID